MASNWPVPIRTTDHVRKKTLGLWDLRARTPPAAQSTPVCRFQGNGEGRKGFPTDEDETEAGGSDEVLGSAEKVERSPLVDEDKLEGELQTLASWSPGGDLTLGADTGPPPWTLDELDGLAAAGPGGLGLVCVGPSSARKEVSGVLQLLSTV